MRFSKLLIPTVKEVPSDAQLPSHIYLLRGGFIQNAGGSGLYNFLPLGKRVLDKVRRVVKEELDRVGCQEVSLAFVTPASLWQESGRYEKYGKELLRFKDRKENEFVLGPTHEEMMVNLVRQSVKSYKQLPQHLYQINWKFRDEVRPRYGLMRGREFLMQDGYSFHVDETDMKREFALMEETYKRIFRRLGLDFRVVEADSGAIGGSGSKEFMVLAESGEDTLVVCKSCDYGANIEAAKRAAPAYTPKPLSQEGKVATPGTTSIEAVARFFDVDATQTLKIVAKEAHFEGGKSEIVLFALRGDDALQEVKACNAVGADDLSDASEAQLEALGLPAGYLGPVGLSDEVKICFDEALRGATAMVCGANEAGYHIAGYAVPEDITFVDIAEVREGDRCVHCGAELTHTKGIEVGHIFQLGTRYSEPLKCEFLDENGKAKPMVMGTYGIGVSRLLAAIIEQHHDDKGCIWTKESAPFTLEIILGDAKNERAKEVAESLYEVIGDRIEVLYDDRAKERFGAKMKDFELMGIPFALIVGKGVNDGKVELVERANGERHYLEIGDDLAETAEALLATIADLQSKRG